MGDTAHEPSARGPGGHGWLLGLALALACAWSLLDSFPTTRGLDFYHYWVVPRVKQLGPSEDLYSFPAARAYGRYFADLAPPADVDPQHADVASFRSQLDLTGSPAHYALLSVFSLGSYTEAFARFHALMVLAGILAVVLLARSLRHTWAWSLALVPLWTVFNGFANAGLYIGNIGQLQLLALALLALRLRSPSPRAMLDAGVILGLLLVTKPNLLGVPLVWGAMLLVDRRWAELRRWLAGLALGAAVGIAAGALYFGNLGCWLDWFGKLREIEGRYAVLHFNLSFPRLLWERLGVDLSWPILALGLATVGACVWRGRLRVRPAVPGSDASREARHLRDLAAIALGAIFLLIFSRLSWMHYYLLATLPVLYLLRPQPGPGGARQPRPVAPLAAGLYVGLLAAARLGSQRAEPTWSWVALVVALILGLGALVVWDLWSQTRAPAPPDAPPALERPRPAPWRSAWGHAAALSLALAACLVAPLALGTHEPRRGVLLWSHVGPLGGWSCVRVDEPRDPHSWDDNYLCAAEDLGLRWSHAGPIAGLACLRWLEAADPDGWDDNYLCAARDLGLRWASWRPDDRSGCIRIVEPDDPHTWEDNYLCLPVSPGGPGAE